MYSIGIAGVFATVLARFIIGPMCDKYGPRLAYTVLLALGSIPVFAVAFAWDYTSFLLCRLAIGVIGASFVITQFHTSVMFAPNVVGTANATVGGWGNAGGGVTQSVMPLILAGIAAYGMSNGMAWRYAQIVPGVLMLIVAVLYWRYTQDTPEGNFADMRRMGLSTDVGKKGGLAVMKAAAGNYRVWLLAACYGASFGVELFVHGIAVTYFFNRYSMTVENAGFAVGAFGLLALFARALGGYPVGPDRPVARAERAHLAAVLPDDGRGRVPGRLLPGGRGHGGDHADAGVRAVHPHGLRFAVCAGAVHRPQGAGRGVRHRRRRRQHRRCRGRAAAAGFTGNADSSASSCWASARSSAPAVRRRSASRSSTSRRSRRYTTRPSPSGMASMVGSMAGIAPKG